MWKNRGEIKVASSATSQTHPESRTEMFDVEAQYFGLSRNILLALGLWPDQQTTFTQIQSVLISVIMIITTGIHLTPFAIAECTPTLVIDILSVAMISLMYIFEHITFWINKQRVGHMLEQLQRMCDGLENKNELAIIERYSNISRRYTTGFTIYYIWTLILFPLAQNWPDMLDVILPRNETRPRNFWFPVEHFTYQQRYFYVIRLSTSVTLLLGSVIGLGILTLLINSQECICSIFVITSYRIKCAMRIDVSRNASAENQNFVTEGIAKAIDIHCKATKNTELIMSTFEIMLCFLVFIAVTTLSLNLYRVFQIISTEFNSMEMTMHALLVFIILCYMFIINYVGQRLTNHNSLIFVTAYNVRWYETPIRVQKLILFFLLRGTKDFRLKIAGGLITPSLQCFATLANVSMSYFTLMYSMQK